MFANVRPSHVLARAVMVATAATAFASFAAGCGQPLSSMQPAHVAPEGTFTVSAGADVSIPTGTIDETVDAAKTLAAAAATRQLTDAEKRQVLVAGTNLAVNPPSFITQFGVAWVPVERVEVSLRLLSGAWRFGGRFQFLHQERHGIDLTAGLGLMRGSYGFSIGDTLQILRMQEFTRTTLDVPLVVGKHGDWYRWWAGPRLLASRADTALILEQPANQGMPETTTLASADVSGVHYGVQLGGALGYRWLFVAFELNLVQFAATADLTLGGAASTVDLDSFIIYPSIAVMGEI